MEKNFKKKKELLTHLEDLNSELFQLCVIKVTGGTASEFSKIRSSSGNCTGKKAKPLDLWPQKTRVMCRQLNKCEENLMTKKQQMQRLYPLWKYAVQTRASASIKHKQNKVGFLLLQQWGWTLRASH
ncbi:unnamed protein product [Nyctereutes procyonoides]|uniref:Large ribosomal subunit protein uL29 n=1 Tax=Nyctereutes procyonoides TaxID=34880 RepID=A0A811Z293_NYCPR|nr:unnamed protein product [Nyctereutes procyonoides]